MDHYQISQDPFWHRWIDGIVILVIGISAGAVIASGLMYERTTTVETVRRVEVANPQIESGISTQTPSGVRVEEI